MRYHRLSNEDLELFRDEFVTFLSSLGIDAPEWEQLKKEESQKAGELIDQFSDMVIHRSLTNISALRVISEKEIYVFKFGKEQADLIHLKIGTAHKLTDESVIERLASGELALKALSPEIETGKKMIKGNREMEMYQLMLQGAKPCKESFYTDFKRIID